jgi:hypothetical protein
MAALSVIVPAKAKVISAFFRFTSYDVFGAVHSLFPFPTDESKGAG